MATNETIDQSTQLIDVDRYRIDFTTNDDDDLFNSTPTKATTNIKITNGSGGFSKKEEEEEDEEEFSRINRQVGLNEENDYIERIKYLEEENAKFK